MAINNRTVTIKNVFASTAETNIPNPPVPGQSYRNTGLTSEEVGQGWPFKEIVDSAKFNEAMYEYTTICQQLEKYGFLPWSQNTNYPAGGCALGSDGNVYQAKQPTGPSTTSVDPVTDTSHTYWDLFYYATVTANRALVSNGNGKVSASSTTATEIGYVHGVTSALQTQLNNKANISNTVTTNTAQTITGAKTIATTWTIGSGNPILRFQNTDIVKGTTPAASESANITVYDNESNSATASRLGQFFVQYGTDGRIGTVLRAFQPVHGSTTYSDLGIYYPATGSAYTFAPIPTDTTSTTSRQIATVGWANSSVSNILHKVYDEIVNGIKTFTNRIRVANGITAYNNNITKGTNPTSNQYNGVACYDGSGTYEDTHLLGKHEVFIATDGNVNANMSAYKNEANSTACARLRVLYEKTSDNYVVQFYGMNAGSDTNLSLTKATSSTTDTAVPCMGWVNNPAASTNVVHRTGTETIAGDKTLTSDVTVSTNTPSFTAKHTGVTIGTVPTSDGVCYFEAVDSQNNRLGLLRTRYATSGNMTTEIFAYNPSGASGVSALRVVYPASGNPYTTAPASDVNGSILTTASKSKATRGYFKLGNGMLLQWGTETLSSSGNITITFPTPFSSADSYAITKNYCSDNGTDHTDREASFWNNTSTGATTYNTTADTDRFQWIAIGY